MYDKNVIKSAFLGRVGLRQTNNPAFALLNSQLVYNGSNTLIDHALINVENLDMCARDYSAYIFPAWSNIVTYNLNDRVVVSGTVYISIQAGNLNHLVTDGAWWSAVNFLSEFLIDKFTVAIEDMFNAVFTKKKLNDQTKTLLANKRLYESPGSITDLTVNEGDFVGVEIKMKYTENIITIINRIGLQLAQIQTSPGLRLYLFHSSQVDAIATFDVITTKAVSFQWITAPATFVMSYMNPAYESGGCFYLMYDQNQLIGQAIQKRMNFLSSPMNCGYCNPLEINLFNMYTKFLMIRSVRIKAASRNGIQLWDVRNNEYVFDNNFGINLEVTVKCDLTDFILQQMDVFDYALREQTTVKLLEMMAGSSRSNFLQERIQTKARAELTAPIAGGMGIQKKLQDQIDAVDFEISELDTVCLPCNKKSGLSYGTIY